MVFPSNDVMLANDEYGMIYFTCVILRSRVVFARFGNKHFIITMSLRSYGFMHRRAAADVAKSAPKRYYEALLYAARGVILQISI